MNNGLHSRNWRRPALFAALAIFAATAALPSGPAAAHGGAHDEPYDMTFECELGGVVDATRSCVFDTNGDGVEDVWLSDTNDDGIFDTSFVDTDHNGMAETFYTILGSPFGEVRVRYDHDGDWLYDDEEVAIYFTDPWLWDTDGDGFGDNSELGFGSNPLDFFCTPNGCG
jgi:hypothetical protein